MSKGVTLDSVRKFVGVVGLLLIAAILVAGFLAYFVVSFDQTSRTWFDGLGRPLSKAPILVSWLHDQREWPGLAWFLTDLIVFWGGGAVAVTMLRWGFRLVRPDSLRANQ
jgi:hypothetical protein